MEGVRGIDAVQLQRGRYRPLHPRPQLSIVVPNGCHIMHEACRRKETNDDIIARGDKWLRKWMSVLTAGPNCASGSMVIFVTFDEGIASPCALNERCLRTLG